MESREFLLWMFFANVNKKFICKLSVAVKLVVAASFEKGTKIVSGDLAKIRLNDVLTLLILELRHDFVFEC